MNKNPWNLLVFAIFPLFFLLGGMAYYNFTSPYFQKCADPEYAYLINGAILADFKPDIYYVDHPGTPLTCIIAGVIRVMHLFRPGPDLMTDVLSNPEIFIRGSVLVINALSTIMLLITGLVVYRKTRNIFVALFVQLIPFVHKLGLETMGRMIPESLMTALICLWVIVVIRFIYDTNANAPNVKYTLLFGIISGLSLAVKLTLLPFIFIPLMILPGWKNRSMFLAASIAFFFVFAFPVLFKYHTFYMWVKNIIFHTGSYGKGDSGIFKTAEFFEHLKLQLSHTHFLWGSLILLTIALFAFIIRRAKNSIEVPLAISMILVILLQYLITSKHFAFHYILPGILLTIPIILLSGSLLKDSFAIFRKSIMTKVLLILATAVILTDTLGTVRNELALRKAGYILHEQAYIEYMRYAHRGNLIVSPSYYGCSAVEYSVVFGLQEGGKYAPFVLEKMKKIYPETYFYYSWSKTFYEGNHGIDPASVIHENSEYGLLIADYNAGTLDAILNALNHKYDKPHWNSTEIYHNEQINEAFFRLNYIKE